MAGLQNPYGLREAVEHALDSEDFTPLVRLVFDAQSQDGVPPPAPKDSESAGTSQGEQAGEPPLKAVLAVLQELADDREAEIQQICRCAEHSMGPTSRRRTRTSSSLARESWPGCVGVPLCLPHIAMPPPCLWFQDQCHGDFQRAP